jgi:lysozyme
VGDIINLGGFAPEVLDGLKAQPRDLLLLGASEKTVLDFITEFEGYIRKLNDGTDRVKPYICPAGYPTIGYGSIWRLDGTRVAMSDPPITREVATQLFMQELSVKCAPAVNRLIVQKLHPLSRGSLISFVFNCGEGALKGSNLRKAVNERRWRDVPFEFNKWRMGAGKVLPGLVRRRKDEGAMFMKGVALMGKQPEMDWTAIVEAA